MGVAFTAGPARADDLILSRDEDVRLLADHDAFLSVGFVITRLGAGDFNGDGQKDLALLRSNWVGGAESTRTDIFYRVPSGRDALVSQSADVKILWPFDARGLNEMFYKAFSITDLDGDAKDDLFVGASLNGIVEGVFGRAAPSGTTIDLSMSLPEFYLRSPASVGSSGMGYGTAGGDFNGDGVGDLLVTGAGESVAGSTNSVLMVSGRRGFPRNAILTSDSPDVSAIVGSKIANWLGCAAGDFNGDGKSDIVFNGTEGLQLIWGASTFPALRNLDAAPADVRITSVTVPWPLLGADMTGDGKDELVSMASETPFLLPGELISDGRSDVELRAGYPGAVTSVSAEVLARYAGYAASGDFDGDGKADLFIGKTDTIVRTGESVVRAVLTSDMGGALTISTPSITLTGQYLDSLILTDLDGDGLDDVVLSGPPAVRFPSRTPYGEVYIVYGYRPLRHPTLAVASHEPTSRRATLALSVAGDPVEMMFAGDVVDPAPDTWVAFRPDPVVTLSSPAGVKTLRVKFRNRRRRESPWATGASTLSVGEPGVRAVTNRVAPGGAARFDIAMSEASEVRAWVADDGGREVRRLMEGRLETGVSSVVWDGRNGIGDPVAPGVYGLVVEVHGRRTRRSIVVE
jgi:hypothetical protein